MAQQRPAVADDLARAVLDPAGPRPGANRRGALQVDFHAGKALNQLPEFFFWSDLFSQRVNAGIQHQPHAAQRIGGLGVVVKGNNPHPSTLEKMVQGAFTHGEGQVVGAVGVNSGFIRLNADHVRKNSAGMGLLVSLAQIVLLGQR